MTAKPDKQALLIARMVLIEAIRRKEIYLVVLAAILLSWWIFSIDFFNLQGISKFQRECVLHLMNFSVALTIIVMAARQLPREFTDRTIYPLLAKPVSRTTFLLGKMLGVWLAGLFVIIIFTIIFFAGNAYLGTTPNALLFFQHIWLQLIQMLILITLSFVLSMLLNIDATIVLSFIFWFISGTLFSILPIIYPAANTIAKWCMKVMVFVLPQLSLFDLSEKIIHSERNAETHAWTWPPLDIATMSQLTVYGVIYVIIFFAIAYFLFRRRPL